MGSRLARLIIIAGIGSLIIWGRGEAAEASGIPGTSWPLPCHIVESGDTLYKIAQANGTSVEKLMNINKLRDTLIRPGEILLIPVQPSYHSSNTSYLSRGDFSREDVMLLARIIYAEARGESFTGQVAVGAVILNRVASPGFPKTIREVIFQKENNVYQFSPVADGTINLEPDETAINAALQALMGQDPTNGALFFYNPSIAKDRWIRTLPVVSRIGNHVFATKA